MRINFRSILLLSTILFIAIGTTSDAKASKIIDDTVTSERYPDHDAVVILNRSLHKFQVYLELYTSTRKRIAARTEIKNETRIKILDEKGFDRFGNFESRTYNKEIHEYKLEIKIISPEGKKKKVGKKNIKRIEIADKYFSYRVAFPGLQVGSIIEIKEEIKSEYPMLSGTMDFGHSVPTLRSELIFEVPAGTKTRFNVVPAGAIADPKPRKDGRYDIYEVTLENIPPYPNEIYMSPEYIGNPTIHYYVWMISNSTLARVLGISSASIGGKPYMWTWKDISESFCNYFDPEIWENDDKSDEYRNSIETDIDQARNNGFDLTDEKMNELLSWFRSEFEAIDDDLFYFSSNPEESFKLRKGGPYELAYVLRYILDQLGVGSSVILVRDADKGLLNRNMPSFSAFTHPLLHIEMMGKEFWLDPFSHFCRVDQLPWQCRGIEGLRLLKSGTGQFTTLSLADAEANCVRNKEIAVIDEEGNLTSTTDVTFTGQHLLSLRKNIDENDPESFKESIKEKLKEYYPETFDEKSLEIVEDGNNELTIKYTYSIPSFADVAGGYMNIVFSDWFSKSLSRAFKTDTRKCDIQYPFLDMECTDVTIQLPEGIKVLESPESRKLESDYFLYDRQVIVRDNMIRFKRTLKVLKPTIEVDRYAVAKAIVNEIYLLDDEEMVVQRQ
ncbi:MAG: DUF3857 domain-containing protein [Bacteroidales bacterium]|nr:DUF3857 domain-containing protein [Candidatus Latescibacterota bacterium]